MIERIRLFFQRTTACAVGFHKACDGMAYSPAMESPFCPCPHHERELAKAIELFLEVQ